MQRNKKGNGISTTDKLGFLSIVFYNSRQLGKPFTEDNLKSFLLPFKVH